MEKGVVVTIYEEAPERPSSGRGQAKHENTRASGHVYDRRAMLLAYSCYLRELNTRIQEHEKMESPPEWKRWKASFKSHNCKKKRSRGGTRRRTGSWIYGVFRRRRRDYRPIVADDQDGIMETISCSNYVHRQLRHFLNRISVAWRARGGITGCYQKLS